MKVPCFYRLVNKHVKYVYVYTPLSLTAKKELIHAIILIRDITPHVRITINVHAPL